MKNEKRSLILFLFFLSALLKSQSFDVAYNTLNIPLKKLIKPAIDAELTHAVKLKNKYVCFFKETKKSYNREDLKFCFLIAEDGHILKKIDIPDEIKNSIYYDLFLRNDSAFVKTYMDNETFFLQNTTSTWVKTKKADDILFEDERFRFTYFDFGEWGATTWCKDKRSGKEYELASSGTLINKRDSVYYITSGRRILLVEDPTQLKPCDRNYYYENFLNTKHAVGSEAHSGTKIIFSDSTDWEQKKPAVTLETSFIANNQLYHLCSNSTRTFIAKLENGNFIPIQQLDEKFSVFDWYFSDRNKVQKDNSQLLKFKTTTKFGLIEINGQTLKIHYMCTGYR